jgi:hypothetical protein
MTEIFLALAIAAMPTAWRNQIPQDPLPPAPVSQLPSPSQEPSPSKVAAPTPVEAALTPAERQDRRDNISLMEGLLASAVGNGARKIQADNPGVALVATGQPRARGFVVDGYGLFFDVEIPELTGSVELSMNQLQRELARRVEQQVSSGARRTADGQAVPVINDPNTPYREAVIAAVITAMLNFKNLNVQPNEWLTVALRGSELPLLQMGIRDSRTLILRIKGSDLADYLASRISGEEAVKRVEKREF